MMRISHTCRSRSPVTHPKTPVGSTPRPITAAAPRKRAPTLYYKSHPSYSSYYWPLPTKPPLSRFLQRKALTLPPQSCAVKPPSRVAVLVPAVDHSARRHHRPAPRDGLPPLLYRPGQESQRSRASCIFLLALAPLRHMPGAAPSGL
jgi:hypothetical protein